MVILLWIAIFPFYTPNERLFYVYQFMVAVIVTFFTLLELTKITGSILLCLYPLVIIISCVFNWSTILYTQIFRGVILALLILDIFLLLHKYLRTKSSLTLFNIFYGLSKLYLIINILWVLALIITDRINEAVRNNFLFSKSKFTVAYMCIFFLMFYCIIWSGNKLFSKKYKRIIFIMLSLICIMLCVMVQTATGVIAVMLFTFLMLLPQKKLQLMNNPVILVTLILVSMWIIFSLSLIVTLPDRKSVV